MTLRRVEHEIVVIALPRWRDEHRAIDAGLVHRGQHHFLRDSVDGFCGSATRPAATAGRACRPPRCAPVRRRSTFRGEHNLLARVFEMLSGPLRCRGPQNCRPRACGNYYASSATAPLRSKHERSLASGGRSRRRGIARVFRDRLRSVVVYGPQIDDGGRVLSDAPGSLSCLALVTSLTVADLEACAARPTAGGGKESRLRCCCQKTNSAVRSMRFPSSTPKSSARTKWSSATVRSRARRSNAPICGGRAKRRSRVTSCIFARASSKPGYAARDCGPRHRVSACLCRPPAQHRASERLDGARSCDRHARRRARGGAPRRCRHRYPRARAAVGAEEPPTRHECSALPSGLSNNWRATWTHGKV